MPTLDDFKNLLEIQSLELKIKTHLDKILEEENRITFVSGQKENKKKKLEEINLKKEEIKKSIALKEKELFEFENGLTKAKSHYNDVQTQKQAETLEHEIKVLEEKIAPLEEDILSLIEQDEVFDQEVTKLSGFIKGVDETIEELKEEVLSTKTIEQGEISKLEQRTSLLLDNTQDKQLVQVFNKVNEKYRYQRPLAFLSANKCSICKFSIPGQIVESVENSKSVELCSGCKRLLTPLSAR